MAFGAPLAQFGAALAQPGFGVKSPLQFQQEQESRNAQQEQQSAQLLNQRVSTIGNLLQVAHKLQSPEVVEIANQLLEQTPELEDYIGKGTRLKLSTSGNIGIQLDEYGKLNKVDKFYRDTATQLGVPFEVDTKNLDPRILAAKGLSPGDPLVYRPESETAAERTKAVTQAREKGKGTLKPATTAQLQNPKLQGRIQFATDPTTGQEVPLIKMRELQAPQIQILSDQYNAATKLQENMEELQRLAKKAGVKPDPTTGRIPLLGDAINTMTKSPEWQTWAAKVRRAFASYVKAETGAQRGFKEIEFFKAALPTEQDKDPETFTRKSIDAIQDITQTLKRNVGILEDLGYEVGGIKGRLPDIPESNLQTTPNVVTVDDLIQDFGLELE